ncbi:unnamed protein product [Heterobilharzia americana]|nr:unnamed protein product [Heterobilharzia americana]
MYLQFHCNALSWIVVDNKHSIDSMLKKNRIDTHLLNNSIPMNILPSEENNNNNKNNNNNNHDETLTTTTTTTKHLSIVNNFDWICIDDICKECISVQATITRCLEFQVYRLPYTNGGIVNGDENFIDLGICIRFTISDGSGSALVQLGNPPCLSSSRSTTSTASPQIPSSDNLCKTIDNSSIPLKNDYSNVNYSHNNYNDLELARLLLGFNPSLWKRLCSKLKYMLNQDRLKPKNNFISIQLALKMYLNSPTFLRNCRFNLKRRMMTSRNCCPSKMTTTTTTTTIPSSSSEYWRLKRVNLKKENNFLSLNNKYEHEQQSVYFVLPPYKLYTLLNVISHNDDFVFQ